MARSLVALGLVLLWTALAAALQVTPNSPCASFCIDSNDLDYSDPNSSNTRGSDITCGDRNYANKPVGQKFERCMTCLQTSTFAQGSENDQHWFLYNLRYAFDYCLFGFPNNTNVGSNPCITTTACGPLRNALQDGDLDPLRSTQYSYCQADNGAMSTIFYDKCLACVRAGDDSTFMANYLVALEAGCRQLPAPGKTVGLNDTIFSNTVIGIVDPTPTKAPAAAGPHLATPSIVAIAVGAVLVLLVAAGCGYVQHRKRLARRRQQRGINPDWHRHRHQSSLSFRCQTHLSPQASRFPIPEQPEQYRSPVEDDYAPAGYDDEKKQPLPQGTTTTDVEEALGSNPIRLPPKDGVTRSFAPPPVAGSAKKSDLQSITTSLPNMPPRVHSPASGTQRFAHSPDDYHYTTPTSSVSVRSTTALLPAIKAYVPAEHAGAATAGGIAMFSSPTSANTASPLFTQGSWPLQQQQQQQPSQPRQDGWEPQRSYGGYNAAVAAGSRNVLRTSSADKYRTSTGRNSGSPVESRQIQVSFPGPPTRK